VWRALAVKKIEDYMGNAMSWFSMISFIASIASLTLAIVAIWIAFYFKAEADKVSEKISDLLLEVKSDAKSISQVAMPELKAYGDSMRRFILRDESISEEGRPEPEIISKLDAIDKKIKALSSENDIAKLKSKLSLVSKDIEESEEYVVQRIVSKSKGDRFGIRLNFGSNDSIETSSPTESWQLLLKTAMRWGSNDYQRDEYGEKWILLNKDTNTALSKKYIMDESATFEDAGLSVGDDFSFIKL
jgi:hypothetical protein